MHRIPPESEPASEPFSPLRAAALGLYCAVTQPIRRHLAAVQSYSGQSRVMSFFYHRVAAMTDSPWTAPIVTFQRQIEWLRARYELVSLSESLRRIRFGNTRPSVHITFDDGYADNCSLALPYLVATRVPVTYFVATQHILSGKPFQHDARLGNPLPVNTPQQIRAMADAGIEIGSHTRHHVDLGQITDAATLHDEIVGSKHELEDMLGRSVRYFSFPYGLPKQMTPAAVQLLREAGYEAICSAFGGYNFPGNDPFHVQRIHGDNEMARFKNWATMDPRKLRVQFPLPIDALEAQIHATSTPRVPGR